MPVEKHILETRITRLIHAPKWRVIRLVTKVWDFPSFVPTVKEATVIHKAHNHVRTKWHIQVDSVPIKWVEEDTLELENGCIRFKAIEGDLETFEGEWFFRDHPEGTHVEIVVRLAVGIPAIQEFADAYIQKMVRRNFEAILESADTHLISMRYQGFKQGDLDKVAGFGVIGHFYNFNHLVKCFRMLSPEIKLPSREFLGQLFSITPSFKLYDVEDFRSKAGAVTRGCFIVATFIPDMIEKDMWAIFSKVVRACKIAEKHGVGVVTLGGFTSIVAERIGHEIANEVDVAVTTGNTYASIMAIDGILEAARRVGLDLRRSKAAIIGGTGDIGSACARSLTECMQQVTITGRNKGGLRTLHAELSKRRKARIVATTDNRRAVRDADMVITAASSTQSILEISWFKPGAVICDVGFPKNIPYVAQSRGDIFIFSGGLAKSPTPISFPVDTGLPAKDALYGCFAEAIILALDKRYESFSYGRGNITLAKMEELRAIGAKHGFGVSDLYWGDMPVSPELIENVKDRVHA
ncbi:MAG: SRPBCC family protein, partial [bacterium]